MATVNCCYKHSSKYHLFCSTEEKLLEQLEGEQIIKKFLVNYAFDETF